MDLEATVRELGNKQAIEQLRYTYAHRLDNAEWGRWGELFAEDGVFRSYRTVPTGSAEPFEASGREAIVEFAEDAIDAAFEYSAHNMYNPRIEIDGETASGRWYFDAFTVKPNGYANWHQGRYEDEYTKANGEWQFAEVTSIVTADTEDVVECELESYERGDGKFPTVRFPC
jgi:hypothetical protein